MTARRKESAPGAFSAKLNEYINESEYSIYKLAQITDLGRTAIQNVLSGKLLPAKPFVERLCAVLPITPRQRCELMELYLRDKIGEKAYVRRAAVKHIIETLPQYYTVGTIQPKFDIVLPEIKGMLSVTGIININNIFRSIIIAEMQKDSPFFETSIPFEDQSFIEMAMHLLSCPANSTVFNHYIRLYKDDEADISNLQTLESALKMSMCGSIVYRPYYYYIYRNSVDDCFAPYPYFLVTSEYSVLLSKDYNSAVVSTDAGLRSRLAAHIKDLSGHSQLMIDVVDEKRMFDIFAVSSPIYKHSIEFQPCLTSFITPDIVAAKLKDVPGRDNILSQLEKYFFSPEGMEFIAAHEGLCSFTKEGLRNFAETGLMINLPGILIEQL
ncbi:MAG: helix-turn-helix domain-containing protein, partial [Oscillospiraceae bacterium]